MRRRIIRHAVATLALFGALWLARAVAQDTVLDMPSWQATEPGTSDWWNALIEAFEAEHEGVEVTFTHEPFTSYNQTMVTRFAGGNPPDILHLPAANFQIYAQEGWLEPLDERMQEAGSPILDEWTPIQETCVHEGQTLCAIVLGYGYVLGWNQQAFEEAGLDGPPTSSDELIEMARQLTVDEDGDGTIDRYGIAFPTITHPGVEATATSFIFEYGPDAHWVDAEGALNREAIRYAWTQMRRMVEDGSVPLGLDNNGKRQFFAEGRAAMMFEGPWIQGFIDSAAPEVGPHLRVAQQPLGGTAYGGASNILAIPAGIDPDRKDLAWDFIQLFSTPEWQADYAAIAGQPPARMGVLTEDFLADNANMQVYVQAASVARDYTPPGLAANYTEFRDLAVEATLAAVVQGEDMDAVLDRLQRDVDRLR